MAARARRQQALHEEMATGWRRWFFPALLGPTAKERYHWAAAREYARLAQCYDEQQDAVAARRCDWAAEELAHFTSIQAATGGTANPTPYMAHTWDALRRDNAHGQSVQYDP